MFQGKIIEYLIDGDKVSFELNTSLNEKLKYTANLRLKYKNESLEYISNLTKKSSNKNDYISKSGLKHRLDKIVKYSQELN